MKIKAIIFDLDGTVTRPILDFDQIRAEIGDIEGPILEAMEQMSPGEQQRTHQILARHEHIAAENSQLNPGVHELFAWLRQRGMSIGLVTRNQRRSVERICELHNLSFDSVITRQDGPAKPDPAPVQLACAGMGVEASESVMVGDYLFDLVSGRRAGAVSVLLTTSENHRDYKHEADYVIDSLNELPAVIDNIEKGAGGKSK